MKRLGMAAAAFLAIGLAASPATAGFVTWTDWTAATTGAGGSATGELDFGETTVQVLFSGQLDGAQTNGGTNYWNPDTPFLSSTIDNAPGTSDILRFSEATTRTITFSQAVVDPIIAIVSLNSNTFNFQNDFEILSSGWSGWGGTGSYLEKDGNSLGAYLDASGVIQFKGTFTSLTWTSTSFEYWSGITVGAQAQAQEAPVVPEPTSIALLAMGGLGLVGGRVIRNRRKSA